MRRLGLIPLALVGLALACSAGAAAQAPPLELVVLRATSGAGKATIHWRVSGPARVVVRVEIVPGWPTWSKPVTVRAATEGRTMLSALDPGQTYRFLAIATAGAKRVEYGGTFDTKRLPGAVRATTTPRALVVDRQPFFPRMVWKQCPSAFPRSLAAGINTFMGTGCGDTARHLSVLGGRGLSILDVASRGTQGLGLIGWHQLDEADEHVPPEALPILAPSRSTGRVTFLTLTNHFFSGAAPLPGGRGMYAPMIARAEMIGFDLYPLQIWCRRGTLHAVFDAQRELVELARGKPTFQWIEAGPMGICQGFDPSAAIVRAETWLAVAGGARGIGYFPSHWRPDVSGEVTRLNRELGSLAPALLGAEGRATTDPAGPMRVGVRRLNGATYVIAVNSWTSRLKATFTVEGLGNAQLRPLGEERTLRARDGKLSDYFRGLQVRVYVVPPVGG